MRKNNILILLLCITNLISLGWIFWHHEAGQPKSRERKIGYAVGVKYGQNLKRQKWELDPNSLAQGVRDGYTTDQPIMSDDEMEASLAELNADRRKAIQAEGDVNKAKGQEFLEHNRLEAGVKVTASGLQYKIEETGTGPSPKPDDIVVIHYRGKLIDGSEFDSSYQTHQPSVFPTRGVIPGWSEGLQLMKKGGKATFYLPPEIAYGDQPRHLIPPNSVLIFEVEMLEIKPPGSVPDNSPTKRKGK